MKKLNQLEIIAKSRADNFEPCTFAATKDILSIAEAFRALEHDLKDANVCVEAAKQEIADLEAKLEVEKDIHDDTMQAMHLWCERAKEAEAKLAELAKQKPVGYVSDNSAQIAASGRLGYISNHQVAGLAGRYVYTRPAPASDLAELVPGDDLVRVLSFAKFVIKCVRKNGEYAPLSSQEPDEIAAILRNIEEVNKK